MGGIGAQQAAVTAEAIFAVAEGIFAVAEASGAWRKVSRLGFVGFLGDGEVEAGAGVPWRRTDGMEEAGRQEEEQELL